MNDNFQKVKDAMNELYQNQENLKGLDESRLDVLDSEINNIYQQLSMKPAPVEPVVP